MCRDALIVGRGIAGNTLALTLLELGASIKVVDSPNPTGSSRIAAGLFNPFTGKRTTKTWLAEELFPFLNDFYKKIEAQTGKTILYSRAIYRPFLSNTDYNDWSLRIEEEDFSDFVNANPNHEKYSPWINNPLGGIECKQSGYVDTKAYLDSSKQILETSGVLSEEELYYIDLEIQADHVRWKGEKYKYVVFCEGIRAMQNPYFEKFPMVPNKGELVTLSIPNYPLAEIISKGVFLVRKNQHEFQLGSTYRWVFEDDKPEKRGEEELIGKLKKWFKADFQVLKTEAAIRPASKDRRPLLGHLNTNPCLLVFNGLGTKGVSLAPYWAKHLSEFILYKKDLNPDVDIRRFYVN